MASSSSSSGSRRGILLVAGAAAATATAAAITYYNRRQRRKASNNKAKRSSDSSVADVPTMIQTRFEQCATYIKNNNTTKISQSIQLELYGYYKQATMGDCDGKPPPSYDLVAVAKYKAWNKNSGMDRTTAMQAYIDKVVWLEFTKEMINENDDDGDINYDDMDDDDDAVMNVSGVGNKVSTLIDDDDEDGEEGNDDNTPSRPKYSQTYPLHAAAQANQLDKLKGLVESSSSSSSSQKKNKNDNDKNSMIINTIDSTGQTALHLAADRGNLSIVQYLILMGADINAKDQDGIGVLQAAVISSATNVVKYLLENGADPDQPDDDGDTPRQCAQDADDPLIRELFDNNDGNKIINATITTSTPAATTTPSKEDIENELNALENIPMELDDDGDM